MNVSLPSQPAPRSRLLLRQSLVFAALSAASIAGPAALSAQQVGDVFYIAMENHNWTQPNGNVTPAGASTGTLSTIQQLFGNSAAPFINSLVTPGNPNAAQVSYASAYYNVLATPNGANPSIHPSEPNYIWHEGGSNFGVANDNDPYVLTGTATNVSDAPTVTSLLQAKGGTWKSYQEGIDLVPTSGKVNQPGANSLTNTVAPVDQHTVPLKSFSGTSPTYTNPYNGSHQYNFAAKHDGQLFFTGSNGGTVTTPDFTPGNLAVPHYQPLEQLSLDLAANTVGRYNFITPDQYNDMHTVLTGGFTYNGIHYTGDSAAIAQGDNFLSIVVPMIMASDAYKNNGAIVIWNDEVEPQAPGDTHQNDFSHSSMEIVISPLAKGNAYNSVLTYTHSSDVETLQELFGVGPDQGIPFIGQTTSDVAGNRDLADLFVPGAIPTATPVPEPATTGVIGASLLGGLIFLRRRKALAASR